MSQLYKIFFLAAFSANTWALSFLEQSWDSMLNQMNSLYSQLEKFEQTPSVPPQTSREGGEGFLQEPEHNLIDTKEGRFPTLG